MWRSHARGLRRITDFRPLHTTLRYRVRALRHTPYTGCFFASMRQGGGFGFQVACVRCVIPAQAGIFSDVRLCLTQQQCLKPRQDSHLRGNDGRGGAAVFSDGLCRWDGVLRTAVWLHGFCRAGLDPSSNPEVRYGGSRPTLHLPTHHRPCAWLRHTPYIGFSDGLFLHKFQVVFFIGFVVLLIQCFGSRYAQFG